MESKIDLFLENENVKNVIGDLSLRDGLRLYDEYCNDENGFNEHIKIINEALHVE